MPDNKYELDNLVNAMGAQITPGRKAQIFKALEDVSLELAKLRQLDLHAVHPAVVFRPEGTGIGDRDDF